MSDVNPNPTGPPADPAPSDPPAERTFTQAQVTAMMAQEKAQGKRAAEEALAKDLGCTPAEAKAIIEGARKRADEEKSEAQLAKEAADRAKAEADASTAASARETLNTRIEAALMRAGVVQAEDDKDGSKFDARLNRLRKLVDVEPGADVAAIAAAVKTLKDEEPTLFGVSEPKKKVAPNSDPSGKPPPNQPNTDAFTRGADRAKSAAGAGSGYSFMNKT